MRTKFIMAALALTGCIRLSDPPADRDGESPSGALTSGECTDDYQCTYGKEKCAEGACVPYECGDPQLSCGLYGCADGVCLTACTGDDECAEGNACREGACYDPDASCYSDRECGGLKCVDYRCTDPSYCVDAADCRGEHQACSANQCVEAQCTWGDDSPCAGFRCLEGLCGTTCETSSDCAARHYCDENGACQPAECYSYTDCDDGFTCNDGRCIAGCHEDSQDECGGYACYYDRSCRTSCSSDYDCADSHRCKLEQCIPR